MFWATGAAALVFAVWSAWRRHWVCDDAFISFRYAENLVQGFGLVYNQAERVEGYSNFLWTIWTAFGLWLGADAQRWVKAFGLACYAASLGLLVWNSWTIRREASGPARWLPLAALLGALHPDWHIFATSGLETSLFTLQITLVYVVLARGGVGFLRGAVAGLILALTSMTRPDGPILAVAAGLFVLFTDSRRPRAFAALVFAFLLAWLPYTIWRVNFYGDYFPNTYYAKSASIAWYSQGAIYLALYFARYWPLLLGLPLVALAWLQKRQEGDRAEGASDSWRRRAALAATLALVYTTYVMHVGGDFMFARFLIPVTPLFLLLIELGITRLPDARVRTRWLLAGVAAAGIVLTPYPLSLPFGSVRGIVFEPTFYSQGKVERARQKGLALRRFFTGLPVRVAFLGGEAELMYYARPLVAIECSTGLTDRHIARQPLSKRGRVGHEKTASRDYVIDARRAHFVFFAGAAGVFGLDEAIPQVDVDFDGVRGRVLTWDPALMDSLRSRGATFTDFPAELDSIMEHSSLILESEWQSMYDKVHRFYFATAPDPRREELLLRRAHGRGATEPSP